MAIFKTVFRGSSGLLIAQSLIVSIVAFSVYSGLMALFVKAVISCGGFEFGNSGLALLDDFVQGCFLAVLLQLFLVEICDILLDLAWDVVLDEHRFFSGPFHSWLELDGEAFFQVFSGLPDFALNSVFFFNLNVIFWAKF